MGNEIEQKPACDYRFKLLYAVAMIMVVGGHCWGGGLALDFSGWFPYYELHLALFMFASGYFYKSTSESNVRAYIWKKTKRLIIPLYLYNLAYGILVHVLRRKGFHIGGDLSVQTLLIRPIMDGHQFIYNLGGWFVIPLFMIELYTVLLRRLCRSARVPEWAYFAVNVCIGIIGNELAIKGHNTGWWLVLVRMLHFIPYHGAGIIYRRVLEKHERKIPCRYYFACILLMKLAIYLFYGFVPTYSPSWCNDFANHPILPIAVASLGIAFWMRLATLLEPVFGKTALVNLIADNTYAIMLHHFAGFMFVKTAFAAVSKYTRHFSGFNWTKYKTDIWYYFVPRGIQQSLILYVIAGVCVSILIQKLTGRIHAFLRERHTEIRKRVL